jgi:hypothetical protein
MTQQLLVNTIFFFSGFIFLVCRNLSSPYLICILAYIVGAALWGVLTTLYIVIGVLVSKLSLGIGMTGFLLITCAWGRAGRKASTWDIISQQLVSVLISLLLIVSVNYILDSWWLPQFSFDSYAYMAAGKTIANNGFFPIDLPGKEFFLNARMAHLPALLAIGYLFGVDLFISLFPLLAVSLIILTVYMIFVWLSAFHLTVYIRLLLALAGGLAMAVTPAFVFHSFYFHTNMITACYYTVAIIAILHYRQSGIRDWLVLAALMLGAASHVRIEMIYFAFFPILLLFSKFYPREKDMAVFFMIFLTITFGWHFYRLYWVGLSLGYHNFGKLELMSFFLYLAVGGVCSFCRGYLSLFRFTERISVIALLALLGFVAFSYRDNFMESFSVLLQIIFENKSQAGWGWGSFWIFLFVCLAISFLYQQDQILKNLSFLILMYWLLRIILYSTPLLAGSSQWYSGSRILLHIFPAAVIFSLTLFGQLLSKYCCLHEQLLSHRKNPVQ